MTLDVGFLRVLQEKGKVSKDIGGRQIAQANHIVVKLKK
jgi:hypothetical protein